MHNRLHSASTDELITFPCPPVRKGNSGGRVLIMAEVAFKGYPSNPKSVVLAKPAAPDLLSYLCIYGARIVLNASGSTPFSQTVMYTCPAGKTFFLVRASVSLASTDIFAGTWYAVNRICIGDPVNGVEVATLYISHQMNAVDEVPFMIPLRLTSGESLINEVSQSGAVTSYGYSSIYGYEIDTALLNSIL